MKKNKYINWDLLVRHMSGELSKEEEIVFKNWIKVDEKHRKYYERMVEEWNRETLYERDLLASCLTLSYYLKHKEKNGSWLFVKELSVGAWQLP